MGIISLAVVTAFAAAAAAAAAATTTLAVLNNPFNGECFQVENEEYLKINLYGPSLPFIQIFYPGLDRGKVEAMQRVGVGHLAHLHLEWESPWWARGEGGLSLAWGAAELKERRLPHDWTRFVGGFSEVEGQRGLLACWVAGSGARVVDQLDDKEVRSLTINIVLKYF